MRFFNNLQLDEFKKNLKDYFKIDYEISLIFKNNNKNINLDKIGFDKKNNCFLNLKQLRLNDKNIIFITKQESDTHKQEINENNEELDEKINTIVKLEDDDENHEIVKIRLNQTFDDLIKKIKKKLNIDESIIIRLRK